MTAPASKGAGERGFPRLEWSALEQTEQRSDIGTSRRPSVRCGLTKLQALNPPAVVSLLSWKIRKWQTTMNLRIQKGKCRADRFRIKTSLGVPWASAAFGGAHLQRSESEDRRLLASRPAGCQLTSAVTTAAQSCVARPGRKAFRGSWGLPAMRAPPNSPRCPASRGCRVASRCARRPTDERQDMRHPVLRNLGKGRRDGSLRIQGRVTSPVRFR